MALQRALQDTERGLGGQKIEVSQASLLEIAKAADGDVRRALTLLEIAAELAQDEQITADLLSQVLADRSRRFDKRGEQFYDQISALHKSVRSSNPDAALYWLLRMLDGGCDPIYLARRLTRIAIEDIGLADPRAQSMALEAWDIYERLGSPEEIWRSRSWCCTWQVQQNRMLAMLRSMWPRRTFARRVLRMFRYICAMHRPDS